MIELRFPNRSPFLAKWLVINAYLASYQSVSADRNGQSAKMKIVVLIIVDDVLINT